MKESKDTDFRLVFYKKKQRNCPLNFFSCPNDIMQKTLDLSQLCRPIQNSSNPKIPNLKNRNSKAFHIFTGFEQLSSSIGCRIMADRVLAQIGHVW